MRPTESSSDPSPPAVESAAAAHAELARREPGDAQQQQTGGSEEALPASNDPPARRRSPRKTAPCDYRALSLGVKPSPGKSQAAVVRESKKKVSREDSTALASEGDAYEEARKANIKANEELWRSLKFDVSIACCL